MSEKVEIRLEVEHMAEFMSYKVYTSAAGIISLVLGVFNIGLAFAFVSRRDYLLTALFLFFAVLLLLIFPRMIKSSVRKKMANSHRFAEPVTYEFTEEGIITTIADDSGKASWGKFKRAVSKKQILILLTPEKQAIILPVDQLGDHYTPIVDMIYANMPAPAVRIRRLDGKKGF